MCKQFLIATDLLRLNCPQETKIMGFLFEDFCELVLNVLIIVDLKQEKLYILLSLVTHRPLTLTFGQFIDVKPFDELVDFLGQFF